MIPLAEAQQAILDTVVAGPTDRVSLDAAVGLVLARDVVATESVPPFANSAMDGFAVRAGDVAAATPDEPVGLVVVGEAAAGHLAGRAVGEGEAIRIMTGAPMPDGADAVVMVERTRPEGDRVLVGHAARVGEHVRDVGGDVAAGERVLDRGTELRPAHLGVLASIGVREVDVVARVRLGVLSTGDELVDENRPLAPGEIRDSNRPMLLALARDAGCDAVDLGRIADDETLLERTLRAASIDCDAIVTSGGVSVGDYDVVKAVLGRVAAMRWWQVAIRPAKPLAFGMLDGTPVFGLPGNPVSSLVSFELFARPALRQMMGHASRFREELVAVASHDFSRAPDGKLHLDRVRLRWSDAGFRVDSTGVQASNALAATAHANALVLLPDGDGVRAGDEVRVLRLDGPCTR
ncbi:MAG: gephyrin-like molybdotransferase Glp [Acidimicrobiia bacterium]